MGWAGSSTRAPIAATALTPAATRQAALKPWKKALEAAAWTAFASAGWPLWLVWLASSSARPTESWAVRASCGVSAAGSLSLSRLVVERRVDAADHGDAEGASEQAGGVVDGGADAGLGLRHDPHDRFGRGCADESHAAPAEQHLADDLEVAGSCVCGGDPSEEAGETEQTGGDDLLGAEANGELGAEHRHDPHGERDGQQADTRGERRRSP